MSDVVATTQSGVETGGSEEAFQGLWDSGAFDPKGIPPKEAGGQDHDPNAVAQTTAQDDANAPQSQQQDDDQQAQGDQKGGQQTEEQQTYASLNDLLTAHKIDPQSVMGLHVTTKIDGVETQVPLSDVLKSYQLEGHVNNKSIELSNQKSAFEQEQAGWRAATQQALQQHQAMGNLALNMLNHDFNRIDWNTLRTQNPAEFAALQAEFGQRQQQIQGFLHNVQQQAQQEAQHQQQATQQALAQEHQRLMDARQEWRDPQAFAKDRESMVSYARSVGFKDAELSQIFDHRYMLILHDAAQFRALQAAAPQALKQVRQAPKVAAPGSRTDTNPTDARRQAVIDRFNRNPRDDDAAAALFDMVG